MRGRYTRCVSERMILSRSKWEYREESHAWCDDGDLGIAPFDSCNVTVGCITIFEEGKIGADDC